MLPNGKRVLVTGGCGGIGMPLISLLLTDDAEVTVVGRQQRDAVNEYRYIQSDLSNQEDISKLTRRVSELQPDILINLAGVNALTRFGEQSSESIERIVQVNLVAPMLLCRAALPSMLHKDTAQIVNVGSALGAIGAPLMASYCASKAGLRLFSESLRRETAGSAITVTHVNPRAVRTSMNAGPVEQMNRLTKTAEDEPDRVARMIYRAMKNDRHEVNIGFPERFYIKLNSIAPVFVDDALIASRHIGEGVLDRAARDSGLLDDGALGEPGHMLNRTEIAGDAR